MQHRFVNQGNTIVDSDVLTLNSSFFNAAVIKGCELKTLGANIKIEPGSVLLPNGLMIKETEYRLLNLAGGNGWRTIFYRYTENQILGGLPAEIDCIDGVYSQEELIQTSTENEITTIIGWVYKYNSQYEIISPNNNKYPHYLMNTDDFVGNRICGYDLLNYIEVINTPTQAIHYYDRITGSVALFGTPNAATGRPDFVYSTNTRLVIRIPWCAATIGSFIIERKSDVGGEMVFSHEFVGGETILLDAFECVGTVEDSITCSSFISERKALKTNGNSENNFHRVILRPKQPLLTLSTEEVQHEAMPKEGVLKIEIFPPNVTTGSDGVQLLRSVGVSSYNVPQILR